MKSKKQIKIDKQIAQKKAKRKEYIILALGGLVFTFAIFQIVFIMFVSHNAHNQIVMGKQVMTTEVCTQWFNSSMQYAVINKDTPFMFEYNGQSIPIPMDVASEVCDDWKKIKEEVDMENMKNLCEQYAELNEIKIKYINGSKYVEINNKYVLEKEIKNNCLQ